MRRAGVVAVIMMGALLYAASANGAERNVTLKTAAGVLSSGAPVTLSSSNLTFTTSSGNLECATETINETLDTNGTKKDESSVTSATFRGTEAEESCKTTTALGPAKVTASGAPWSGVFTYKGVHEIKKILGGGKITLTFDYIDAGNIQCVFEASTIAGSFNFGEAMGVSTSGQKFKANKTLSAPACPKEGTLSAEWKVLSAGELVEASLT